MNLRGLAIGLVLGAALGSGPVLLYRLSSQAPGSAGSPTVEHAPEAVPSPQRSQATGSGASNPAAAAPRVPTSRPETPASPPPARVGTQQPSDSPAVASRILANLAARQAKGFPPPRQGLLGDRDLTRALAQAEELVATGRLEEAHRFLSDVYFGPELTAEQRSQLARVLEPLAEQLLRSLDPAYYGPVHVVQPGDTPARIAAPFRIPYQYLARLNGFGRYIRVGQRLKIVRGPFDVLVELGQFELVVLLHGRFIKRYPIGIGRDGSSPTGLFRVTQKVVNPTWYPAEGGIVPPDDPRNPLGTRWIGIGGSYGIHGTREPESIGKAASRGCIRMHNRDVEELYDMLVEEHSRVLIRP